MKKNRNDIASLLSVLHLDEDEVTQCVKKLVEDNLEINKLAHSLSA
jgi:hypothetical protein